MCNLAHCQIWPKHLLNKYAYVINFKNPKCITIVCYIHTVSLQKFYKVFIDRTKTNSKTLDKYTSVFSIKPSHVHSDSQEQKYVQDKLSLSGLFQVKNVSFLGVIFKKKFSKNICTYLSLKLSSDLMNFLI